MLVDPLPSPLGKVPPQGAEEVPGRFPMEHFPRDSGIPCKPGKSARAHIAVAPPHSTVCAGMPLFAGSDVGVFTLRIDQLPVCRFAQGAMCAWQHIFAQDDAVGEQRGAGTACAVPGPSTYLDRRMISGII